MKPKNPKQEKPKPQTKKEKAVEPVLNTSKLERIMAERNLQNMSKPDYVELTPKLLSIKAQVSYPTALAVYHGKKRKYSIHILEAIAKVVDAQVDDIRP